MKRCGNLIIATFNLTCCDKIQCVVIGLLNGCDAFQKLEISRKILRIKRLTKVCLFLLLGKYK